MEARGNLFDAPPPPPGSEHFDTLHVRRGVEFVRITSNVHASPAGAWYDQPGDEWVALLRGSATLEYDDGALDPLIAGDWRVIPARRRHRIAHTSHDALWLAAHFTPGT